MPSFHGLLMKETGAENALGLAEQVRKLSSKFDEMGQRLGFMLTHVNQLQQSFSRLAELSGRVTAAMMVLVGAPRGMRTDMLHSLAFTRRGFGGGAGGGGGGGLGGSLSEWYKDQFLKNQQKRETEQKAYFQSPEYQKKQQEKEQKRETQRQEYFAKKDTERTQERDIDRQFRRGVLQETYKNLSESIQSQVVGKLLSSWQEPQDPGTAKTAPTRTQMLGSLAGQTRTDLLSALNAKDVVKVSNTLKEFSKQLNEGGLSIDDLPRDVRKLLGKITATTTAAAGFSPEQLGKGAPKKGIEALVKDLGKLEGILGPGPDAEPKDIPFSMSRGSPPLGREHAVWLSQMEEAQKVLARMSPEFKDLTGSLRTVDSQELINQHKVDPGDVLKLKGTALPDQTIGIHSQGLTAQYGHLSPSQHLSGRVGLLAHEGTHIAQIRQDPSFFRGGYKVRKYGYEMEAFLHEFDQVSKFDQRFGGLVGKLSNLPGIRNLRKALYAWDTDKLLQSPKYYNVSRPKGFISQNWRSLLGQTRKDFDYGDGTVSGLGDSSLPFSMIGANPRAIRKFGRDYQKQERGFLGRTKDDLSFLGSRWMGKPLPTLSEARALRAEGKWPPSDWVKNSLKLWEKAGTKLEQIRDHTAQFGLPFVGAVSVMAGTTNAASPDAFGMVTKSFQLLAAALGTLLVPSAIKLSYYLQQAAFGVLNWSDTTKDLVAWGALLATGFLGLLAAVGKVASIFVSVSEAAKLMGLTFGQLATRAGLWFAGAAAAAYGAYKLWNAPKEQGDKMAASIENLKNAKVNAGNILRPEEGEDDFSQWFRGLSKQSDVKRIDAAIERFEGFNRDWRKTGEARGIQAQTFSGLFGETGMGIGIKSLAQLFGKDVPESTSAGLREVIDNLALNEKKLELMRNKKDELLGKATTAKSMPPQMANDYKGFLLELSSLRGQAQYSSLEDMGRKIQLDILGKGPIEQLLEKIHTEQLQKILDIMKDYISKEETDSYQEMLNGSPVGS